MFPYTLKALCVANVYNDYVVTHRDCITLKIGGFLFAELLNSDQNPTQSWRTD